MAQIIIPIPDNIAVRVNNALSAHYGYQATINGEANPETKAQYNLRMLKAHVKNIVREQEATAAQKNAFDAAAALADSEITLS